MNLTLLQHSTIATALVHYSLHVSEATTVLFLTARRKLAVVGDPVSDATYRIDVAHRPAESFPWAANVWRIGDESYIASRVANTAEEAVGKARAFIVELLEQQEPFSVYVDDQGEPVEQHSVKA